MEEPAEPLTTIKDAKDELSAVSADGPAHDRPETDLPPPKRRATSEPMTVAAVVQFAPDGEASLTQRGSEAVRANVVFVDNQSSDEFGRREVAGGGRVGGDMQRPREGEDGGSDLSLHVLAAAGPSSGSPPPPAAEGQLANQPDSPVRDELNTGHQTVPLDAFDADTAWTELGAPGPLEQASLSASNLSALTDALSAPLEDPQSTSPPALSSADACTGLALLASYAPLPQQRTRPLPSVSARSAPSPSPPRATATGAERGNSCPPPDAPSSTFAQVEDEMRQLGDRRLDELKLEIETDPSSTADFAEPDPEIAVVKEDDHAPAPQVAKFPQSTTETFNWYYLIALPPHPSSTTSLVSSPPRTPGGATGSWPHRQTPRIPVGALFEKLPQVLPAMEGKTQEERRAFLRGGLSIVPARNRSSKRKEGGAKG